jgi:hypothetical protein
MMKNFTLFSKSGIRCSLWIALFAMISHFSYSQVTGYSFAASSGTYNAITTGTGATQHSSGALMDDATFSVSLPFTFNFDGQAVTTVWVSENGFVAFGADPGTTNRAIISSTYAGRAIAGYSGDLGGVSAASNLMSQTIGTAPNRQFVAQWSNLANFGGTTQSYTFQIILNEANGVALNQTAQLVYSAMTVTTGTAAQQVGLRGLTNASFNNRKNSVSLNWTTPEIGTLNSDVMTISTTIFPASGQTYTYTPPAPCVAPIDQPTALVLSPLNSSQINGSFTAAPSTPNGYLIVRYPTGIAATPPVNGTNYTAGGTLGSGTIVQSGAATTFSATGLLPSTTYDFYIYSMNNICTGTQYLTVTPLTGTSSTTALQPPSCPTTFTPAALSGNIPLTQVLSWSGAIGSPAITGYNVYFSTNPGRVSSRDPLVRVITNSNVTSYTPPFGTLAYGVQYYWLVDPINSVGTQLTCTSNSFTTYTPQNIVSTAQGGIWNSIDTWVGGVVPVAGDNVTIADGSIVTVNTTITGINNLTIGQGTSGVLQWNATSNAMTLFGNLTINSGARFLPYTTGGTGQTINIGGNFVNDGYTNLATVSALLNFNGSQQAGGSTSQSLSGSGIFEGDGTNGIIRTLFYQSNGSFTLNTSQNIAVVNSIAHATGSFNTNNKLRIDNTAQIYGRPLNIQVANVAVTGMGSGYTSAPMVYGATATAFALGGSGTVGTRYFSGNEVYLATTTGTFDAVTAPTHTAGIVTNGTVDLLWLSSVGVIGNPFQVTAPTIGTQYFYGNNLYTCIAQTGASDPTNPPTHTSGTAVSGLATYLYVGTAATVTVNHNSILGSVRSLNLTSAGSGYSTAPLITFNGGAGSGATALAVLFQSIPGVANSLGQKSGSASFTGGITINSTQGASAFSGVGNISTTNGGVNYTVAPTVGFAGPTAINLVTAGGSGYTTANPTITVTGGTLISGTALTTSNFTITVNQGRVVSVYLNASTTATYSTPPTLAFTGGTGSGATLEFPVGCWPSATAVIGSNGQITNFNVTNSGFGYVVAPTVGIGTTTGTSAGGTFTTVATAPTCRIGLYNVTISNFTPSPANVDNPMDVIFPANRKINALTVATSSRLVFNSNLEVFGSTTPLTTTAGFINLNSNNLLFSWNGFAGVTGSLTGNVSNGSITLTTRGGSNTGSTLNFPFDATFTWFSGSGTTAANGSTVTRLTASITGRPTGTGSPIGRRSINAVVNSGAVYGTNPTVTLNYNQNDSLTTDAPSLLVGQSAAVSGPWVIRSVGTGVAGASIGGTGSRTTATSGVGPIVPTGNDFYAWISTFVPAPLSYNITRQTNQTYTSIMSGGLNLPWGTAGSVSNDDITASVSLTTIPGGAPTFQYNGQTITGFSMCSNGWIKLNSVQSAATTSTNFTNQMSNLPNIIAAFWDDLSTNPNLGSQAGDLLRLQNSMKYQIIGTTAGSRQIVAEWSNMTVFGAGGPQLSFQIVLNETNNTIKINYGLFQGFNGTNNHRYTYSVGLSGLTINAFPLPGQVMAQQFENTTAFSNEFAASSNLGANGLMSIPECNSSLLFVPGVYAGFTPPSNTPPVNDNIAGAITIPASLSFPANLCGNFYTSRNATPSPQPVCAGLADDDVWFKFTPPQGSITVRVYGSGGYIPRVQVLDNSQNPLSPAQCVVSPAGGGTVDAILTGLTIGANYFVRVYHDGGGVTATVNATINPSGQVTGAFNFTNNGSGYTTTTTGSFTTGRMRITGGGGRDAVAAYTLTGNTVTGLTFNGGYGYTSPPTVTIESPNWAQIGEFAIIAYAPAENDECSNARTLTNLSNSGCVNGQNSFTEGTGAATPSLEAANCGLPDDDIWYKFTAIATTTAISVQGAGGFDPAVEFFDGGVAPGACASKSSISCTNVTGAGGLESFFATTVIGRTYYLRVYHAGTGTVTGETFNICVSSALPACVTAPISPINASNACVTTSGTLLSWPAVPFAAGYDVYLDAGAGPATTIVSTNQAGTTFTTSALTAGSYFWKVIARNPIGDATGCSDFTFTVNNLPGINITPVGPISLCASSTQVLSLGTTTAMSPSYQWQNASVDIPLAGSTSYTANASGNYRLRVTDGITTCSNFSNTVDVTIASPTIPVITPASSSITCSGDSKKLTAVSSGGFSSIKMTEITQFRTGTGATSPYPAYFDAGDQDYVEVSNLSGSQVDVSGLVFELWSGTVLDRSLTFPSGTIIPGNGVLTIVLALGVDQPANRYFHCVGSSTSNSGPLSSGSPFGFIIKSGSTNLDVVATNSYIFPAGANVTSGDFTGSAPAPSGAAGSVRTNATDTNNGTDWTSSVTTTQTIGTYNGGYTPIVSGIVFSWTPSTGLFLDSLATMPYTNQDLNIVWAKPTSTTVFTARATAPNACFSESTATVTVPICNTTLNLTQTFIQGYMNGSSMRSVLLNSGIAGATALQCDTITVELRNGTSPFALAHTFKGILMTDGTISCTFPGSAAGNSYYIAIKGRNLLETWSAAPVAFTGTTPYNFGTAGQAFGGNLGLSGSIPVIYSGDFNTPQDGSIDLIDFPIWQTEYDNFSVGGYFISDLDGDGNVDLADFPIWNTNYDNFIGISRP